MCLLMLPQIRHLAERPAPSLPHWRTQRPSLLVESAEWVPPPSGSLSQGQLALTGWVRCAGLSTHHLITVPGAGEFQIDLIQGPPPQVSHTTAAAAHKRSGQEAMDQEGSAPVVLAQVRAECTAGGGWAYCVGQECPTPLLLGFGEAPGCSYPIPAAPCVCSVTLSCGSLWIVRMWLGQMGRGLNRPGPVLLSWRMQPSVQPCSSDARLTRRFLKVWDAVKGLKEGPARNGHLAGDCPSPLAQETFAHPKP